MLKELFESSFYITYPHKENFSVNLHEDRYTAIFSLKDENACRDCRVVCHNEESKRAQLQINTSTAVHVLNIDELISYIKENVGETCDYLLDDGQKSIFVEMTCSNSEHVASKRQKARRQLYNTLCVLFANPIIRKHFEDEVKKYVVFSWKDTTCQNTVNDISSTNMLGMVLMSDATYTPENVSKFDFGYLLKEIRYPNIIQWNSL